VELSEQLLNVNVLSIFLLLFYGHVEDLLPEFLMIGLTVADCSQESTSVSLVFKQFGKGISFKPFVDYRVSTVKISTHQPQLIIIQSKG